MILGQIRKPADLPQSARRICRKQGENRFGIRNRPCFWPHKAGFDEYGNQSDIGSGKYGPHKERPQCYIRENLSSSERNIRRPNIQLPEYSGIFTKNSLSKMGHFVNIQ